MSVTTEKETINTNPGSDRAITSLGDKTHQLEVPGQLPDEDDPDREKVMKFLDEYSKEVEKLCTKTKELVEIEIDKNGQNSSVKDHFKTWKQSESTLIEEQYKKYWDNYTAGSLNFDELFDQWISKYNHDGQFIAASRKLGMSIKTFTDFMRASLRNDPSVFDSVTDQSQLREAIEMILSTITKGSLVVALLEAIVKNKRDDESVCV